MEDAAAVVIGDESDSPRPIEVDDGEDDPEMVEEQDPLAADPLAAPEVPAPQSPRDDVIKTCRADSGAKAVTVNGTESSESHDTTGSDHPVNNGENSSGNDEENNSGDRGENGLGTPVTEEDAGDKEENSRGTSNSQDTRPTTPVSQDTRPTTPVTTENNQSTPVVEEQITKQTTNNVEKDPLEASTDLETTGDISLSLPAQPVCSEHKETDKADSEVNEEVEDSKEVVMVNDTSENADEVVMINEDSNDVLILDEHPAEKVTAPTIVGNGLFGGDVLPSELDSLADIQLLHDLYGPGHTAIQFTRLHCTACNLHLGSAVIPENERFIHPLLKVIVCRECHSFYCSGEFEKDEDGSEMYCRWCGQGGKVLCCSKCAFVFCQKCIRHNKGKKGLEAVKNSDDWLCFACDGDQITNLRIQCRALYDFLVQEKSRIGDNLELLKHDYSVCCISKQVKPVQPKRKKVDPSDTDVTYDPTMDNIQPVKKRKTTQSLLQSVLTSSPEPQLPVSAVDPTPPGGWNAQTEDEVECTPDLSFLMEEENDDDPPPLLPPPLVPIIPPVTPPVNVFAKKVNNATPPAPRTFRLIASKPQAPNVTVGPNETFLSKPPVLTPAVPVTQNTSVIDAVPKKVVKGSKQEWFERASNLANRVNDNLSKRLQTLATAQAKADSLEQLASVHNSLQEILSNSINSLIQVRKNLRTEFINGIRNLKHAQVDDDVIDLDSSKNNDDDVRIVEKPGQSADQSGRPYLKVKSFATFMCNGPVSKIAAQPLTTTNGPVRPPKQPPKVPPMRIRLKSPPKRDHHVSKPRKDPDSAFVTDAASLVKQAVLESTFKQLVGKNMQYIVDGVSRDDLENMLSVRVFLEKNYGESTPKTKPINSYRPIRIEAIGSGACKENGTDATESEVIDLDGAI